MNIKMEAVKTESPSALLSHTESSEQQSKLDQDFGDGFEIESRSQEIEVEPEVKLSKNKLKKLKKREKWLAVKQDARRNAKLKRKLKLAEMRENGEDLGPTRKSLKKRLMINSSCKIRVAIDLSLDEYMSEKDVNSLTCQLQHAYAANRRAENPLQLYFCGIDGKTKERLDKIGDYKGWDCIVENESYNKVFPLESIVYLSSESDNVLTTLSEDKVYVIGGLVDHNKHKGLCHKLAEEKGIAHAQLPISDYLDMKTRKVLTVNQVFAMLLRFTETQDWRKAFVAEMPNRFNVTLKDASSPQAQVEPSVPETNSDKCEGLKDKSFAPETFIHSDKTVGVKYIDNNAEDTLLVSTADDKTENVESSESQFEKANTEDRAVKQDTHTKTKDKNLESSGKAESK